MPLAAQRIAMLDWSASDPTKRQLALARRDGERWRLDPVRQLDTLCDPARFIGWLDAQAGEGSALVGLDLVLGVPQAWASRAGVTSLRGLMSEAGEGRWSTFWAVADTIEEVSLERPFFPRVARRGQTLQQLIDALGLDNAHALRRVCERPRPGQPSPCPLFWTVGASQVGKGTLAAWRGLIKPALACPHVALWPADGELDLLLERPAARVLAEVYPADALGALGLASALRAAGGKRAAGARRAASAALTAWLVARDVQIEPALGEQLETGFGAGAAGEDAFDALVGLCGLLMLVRGERIVAEPGAEVDRALEGWILGR
jgi:hypothetical protein